MLAAVTNLGTADLLATARHYLTDAQGYADAARMTA
jgi:hypothetical protein